jgi:hypothetical protein
MAAGPLSSLLSIGVLETFCGSEPPAPLPLNKMLVPVIVRRNYNAVIYDTIVKW